jgi:signal transduction histidine kinase
MLSAVATMMGRRRDAGSDLPAASALDEAMQKSREVLDTLRACIPDHDNEAMQSVDINEVLADVLKLTTASLLNAGIVVDWVPANGSAVISGHPAELSNLFKQLITNAIEAVNEKRRGSALQSFPAVFHHKGRIQETPWSWPGHGTGNRDQPQWHHRH